MPLYLFYTMVQKSQKWPKTQIKGGGSCLKLHGGRTWIEAVAFLREVLENAASLIARACLIICVFQCLFTSETSLYIRNIALLPYMLCNVPCHF